MKEKFLMVLFVLVLGSILTTALIGVNGFTAPMIEKNVEIKLKSSVLAALEIPFEIETVEPQLGGQARSSSATQRAKFRSFFG